MKKKKKFIISEDAKKIILVVLGAVLSCVVLFLVASALQEMHNSNRLGASFYLIAIFIVLGLARFVTFLKERTKASLIRFIILLVYNIGLGIIIYFAKDTPYLYQLCGALYCLSIVFSRIFKIISNHTIRSIILNAIIATFAIVLGISLLIPNEGNVDTIVFIICVIVATSTFLEVIANSSSRINASALFKIILKTYALEIIMGFLVTIVAFSLILMHYEENITSFVDGLWYSFAVVTTIGFGDIVATTLIGRIITVILGIYGLIIVAVITSIIVNFYNEMSGKKDQKNIKEVAEEAKKEEKKK